MRWQEVEEIREKMNKLTASDFKIGGYGNRFYVCVSLDLPPRLRGEDNKKAFYMHKDGSMHDYCGPKNFWDTQEDALAVINRHYTPLLPEELFDI